MNTFRVNMKYISLIYYVYNIFYIIYMHIDLHTLLCMKYAFYTLVSYYI